MILAVKSGNPVDSGIFSMDLGSIRMRTAARLRILVVLEQVAFAFSLEEGNRHASYCKDDDNRENKFRRSGTGVTPRNYKFGASSC